MRPRPDCGVPCNISISRRINVSPTPIGRPGLNRASPVWWPAASPPKGSAISIWGITRYAPTSIKTRHRLRRDYAADYFNNNILMLRVKPGVLIPAM